MNIVTQNIHKIFPATFEGDLKNGLEEQANVAKPSSSGCDASQFKREQRMWQVHSTQRVLEPYSAAPAKKGLTSRRTLSEKTLFNTRVASSPHRIRLSAGLSDDKIEALFRDDEADW